MSEHYLVRHGESLANAGLATLDPALVELTGGGRLQASLAAIALRSLQIRPELFVVSAYARARDTAQPAQYLFPEVPTEEWPIHEFTYLGAFNGVRSTVADREVERDAYWRRADPQFVHSPGSESFAQFDERASLTLDRLTRTERTVVLFGHEQLFNMLLYQTQERHHDVDDKHMRGFREFMREHKIPNGSLLSLDVQARRWETLFVPPKEIGSPVSVGTLI